MFFYGQSKESHNIVKLKSTATPCGLTSQQKEVSFWFD